MWIALALPSLHLLAGLGGTADASVSISLQSALLGIDEHSALASGQLSPALLRARRTRDVALAVPLNARLRSLSESPSGDGGAEARWRKRLH
jgi:hypothetical protein